MEVDGTVGMESPGSQSGESEQLSVVERGSEIVRNLIVLGVDLSTEQPGNQFRIRTRSIFSSSRGFITSLRR